MATSFIKSIRHTLDTGRALIPYEPPIDAQVIRIDPANLRQVDEAPATVTETRTLARAPGLEPDVFVPGLQTAITGVAVAIGAGLLAWALAWPWQTPVILCGLALLGAWLWRLRALHATLWETTTETMTGPAPASTTTEQRAYTLVNPAMARADVARETRQNDEDAQRAELLAFVDRCYMCGTGERAHGVKATGPDRRAYIQKRDVLLGLGIAKWRNPARPHSGWVMACSRMKARQILAKHVL